ncbi:MAG: A/G-specific adenine glycosylase [Bacteroidota bacterium]
MNFSNTLIGWYRINKRTLPWRFTNNVYFIWVSEIILQQTRVEQGTSYYHKFIETFPDIASLANAKEEEVLKVWQGLGYYTRARNMHAAAKQVVENFNGVFPHSYDQIIKLKGIGKYTAAAVLSFAYNLPYPVMDGNVKRLITRYFGIKNDISLAETEKIIYKKLNQLIDQNNPADFNQAIMEFGALYCKPGIPECSNCVFSKQCKAYIRNEVSQIPYNPTKTKIRQRFFYYIVPVYRSAKTIYTYIERREKKDIWKNMYEFPLIEFLSSTPINSVANSDEFKAIIANSPYKILSCSDVVIHKLSHQHIYAQFIQIELKNELTNAKLIKVDKAEIKEYPISRLIEQYLLNKKSLSFK